MGRKVDMMLDEMNDHKRYVLVIGPVGRHRARLLIQNYYILRRDYQKGIRSAFKMALDCAVKRQLVLHTSPFGYTWNNYHISASIRRGSRDA